MLHSCVWAESSAASCKNCNVRIGFLSSFVFVFFCEAFILDLFGSWALGSSSTEPGKRLYLAQISLMCANRESVSDVGASSKGPGVGWSKYAETVARHLTI